MSLFNENAGVGIPKNAPKKKGIARFFELFIRKFWKIAEVNLLYSVFFIPVLLAVYAFAKVSSSTVTILMSGLCIIVFAAVIGPATAGMFKIMRNFTIEKHAFILTDFKKTFTENYKKSAVMGILDILVYSVLGIAVYIYPKLAKAYDNKLILIPFVICISAAIIFTMMNYYSYLMIVATDISFKNILKNSFVLSCVALKKNFLTLVITLLISGVFIIAIIWNLSFAFLLPFVPAAIICFIICFNSYPVVQKYVINPYYEQKGEVNPELKVTSGDDEDVLFTDRGGSEKPIEKKKAKKRKTIS
ncbi:YesL family protein [Porcipelethomonas sp.]|uniref:YesL family protein n=1 Tax=Porcipelethomonas sp. TaxID=2981675 RepID=UPI003EF6D235